ncbi:MAG: bifunctional riboflavin kinase/FAD synthetase [bacterium]|nr:bifunctional riboflavin kinase/FAD synthetase [bacterium]
MRVVRHLEHVSPRLGPVVLTLGNFDGVHRGHEAIICRAVDEARSRAAAAAVLTFHPHPVAVLAPERASARIQPLHDRLERFCDLGVDLAVVRRFTPAFAAVGAEAFVTDFLLPRLAVVHVVVGHNVSFGRRREGTVDTLRMLGARHGFTVEDVGPVTAAGAEVSSTALRRELAAGDVGRAAELLGRPHVLRGRVMAGDRRGRTLGFPTANLHLKPGVLLPPDGVYAVRARLDGTTRSAVMNVGVRPTFGGLRHTVEAYLLDFDGDLYGRWLAVELVARLRGEQRFAGVEALQAQIAADVAQARGVLGTGT